MFILTYYFFLITASLVLLYPWRALGLRFSTTKTPGVKVCGRTGLASMVYTERQKVKDGVRDTEAQRETSRRTTDSKTETQQHIQTDLGINATLKLIRPSSSSSSSHLLVWLCRPMFWNGICYHILDIRTTLKGTSCQRSLLTKCSQLFVQKYLHLRRPEMSFGQMNELNCELINYFPSPTYMCVIVCPSPNQLHIVFVSLSVIPASVYILRHNCFRPCNAILVNFLWTDKPSRDDNRMDTNLPLQLTYNQSFNFRSVAVHKMHTMKKNIW